MAFVPIMSSVWLSYCSIKIFVEGEKLKVLHILKPKSARNVPSDLSAFSVHPSEGQNI